MFKELLAKHGINNADLEKDLDGYVAESISKKTKNTIPYERFKEKVSELKNLRADFGEKEVAFDSMKTKLESFQGETSKLKELEERNNVLLGQLREHKLKQWETIKSNFFDDDGKFTAKGERIKDDFSFATEGKQLSIEEIEANINKFTPYKKMEYFTNKGIGRNDPAPNGGNLPNQDDPLSVFPT